MREREISTTKFGKEKVKGKVVPSHEDMGEWHEMKVSGQFHALATLPPSGGERGKESTVPFELGGWVNPRASTRGSEETEIHASAGNRAQFVQQLA